MAEADPQTMFNVHDAKTHFSRLVDRAHAGEEIIVAKAGVPYARLVPFAIPPQSKRKPGGLTVTGEISEAVWSDPLPEDGLAYIDDRPGKDRR